MVRFKRPAKVQSANKGDLRTSASRAKKRLEEDSEEDRGENIQQSDTESLLSTARKSRSTTKRKSRRSSSARAASASPPPVSSVESTPQPAPGPKRKGGNKRKWTHEYCLTCTRYGRACGGRREGEEGCAVCRDPDKAKGEKLRECLWADHEAGVTDYKTAREVFKKAQAELRAQKAKPTGRKKQLSQAVAPIRQLPETTKPLDLLPPARKQSSYLLENFGHEGKNDYDSITVGEPNSAVNGAPGENHPRIHRPQLSYFRHDSDDENKSVVVSNILEPTRHNQNYSITPSVQQRGCAPLYFNAAGNTRVKSNPRDITHHGTSPYYTHPYRSPYDTVLSLPPSLVSCAQPIHPSVNIAASRGLIAPTAATAHLAIARKPGMSPRTWSREGSKVPTISGHQSEVKSWKPKGSPTDMAALDQSNKSQKITRSSSSMSDSSSLSSYMSINEVEVDDSVMSPRRHSHTDHDLHIMDTADSNSNPSNRPANFATTVGNKGITQRPTTLTLPGEITIQEDEEMGTSESDSELTSDEGKLKTLPSKLRKVLSRSRITKVIIGDEVFEIRPKTNIVAAKVQKVVRNSTGRLHASSRGRARKQVRKDTPKVLSIHHQSDSDDSDELETSNVPDSHNGETTTKTPLKIKLIFNRKAEPGSSQTVRGDAVPTSMQNEGIRASVESDAHSDEVDLGYG